MDHIRIMVRIPMILAAPLFLTTSQIEVIQSAVCDVNSTNISTKWHTHMKRVSGLENQTAGLEEFSSYGKSFGISDGTGYEVDELAASIREKYSMAVSYAIDAAAIQQMWMDLMGNTILAFLRGTLVGSPRKEQSRIFEVIFFAYYFVLYLFIDITSRTLVKLPSNKPFLYNIITVAQFIISSVFIIPVGVAGLAMLPFYIFGGREAQPLPSRGNYVTVPDNATSQITYTINLVKPTQDSKVGMRLGFNSTRQIMINSIKPNSIASASDLRAGDVIISVNGKKLTKISPEEVTDYLLKSTGVLKITVLHMGNSYP